MRCRGTPARRATSAAVDEPRRVSATYALASYPVRPSLVRWPSTARQARPHPVWCQSLVRSAALGDFLLGRLVGPVAVSVPRLELVGLLRQLLRALAFLACLLGQVAGQALTLGCAPAPVIRFLAENPGPRA